MEKIRLRREVRTGTVVTGFLKVLNKGCSIFMKNLILLFLLLSVPVAAQHRFDIKKASKSYDIRLEVEKCDDSFCGGKATFTLFKKRQTKPFQTIKLGDTEFMVVEAEATNAKGMYDIQSAVFFEDYNFDGVDDLAVRDGNNGGYGGPSYQIYLFSAKQKKFVHNASLTDLNQGAYLGAMEVDKKKKVLRTFSKSGCCWHQTQEFKIVNNRPQKVYEFTEDAMAADGKVHIEIRRRVSGKWRVSKKTERKKE